MTELVQPRLPSDRVLRPDFIKMWFALLFFMLNMSTFNLLPYYLELRGASPDLYGQVAGSMSISSFLCLVLLGRRADVWSRKATVVFYFAFNFAGNVVALWAMGQESLYWYYPARMLQGVYMGVGFPIMYSWTIELSPPQRRHLVLAWLGIAGIFSNSLGPTIGEFVLSVQPDRNDPAAYFPVFLLSTVFQVCALGCFLLTTNSRAAPDEEPGQEQGMLPLLRRRETLLLLAVSLSFGGVFGVLMSFSKNYTASLNLAFVSVLLWAYTIGAITSRVFIQQISRYVAERQLVPIGLAGLCLTFLVLGFARDYPMLAGTGFLYGLSHGVLYPTLFVRFLDFQRPAEMGRAATLLQGSFSVGWGLFPLLGGTVVRLTGFHAFFTMLAALIGGGIVLHRLAERSAADRAARAQRV